MSFVYLVDRFGYQGWMAIWAWLIQWHLSWLALQIHQKIQLVELLWKQPAEVLFNFIFFMS